MNHESVPLSTIEQCLKRSGYLLESHLVRALTDLGFFVEPNQVIRDVRTGKSREVDLVAEYYNWNPDHRNLCVKTFFVVEVINNKFPFVLLTERPYTPNMDFESYVKFICTPDQNPFEEKICITKHKEPDKGNLFSQYCVLTTKSSGKNELMATHPDDVYGSLQKLSEYIEEQIDFWHSREDKDTYWRAFFWLPILVVGGQLVTVTTAEDGNNMLQEASSGYLEFNWHYGDEPRTTLIEILTVSCFLGRVQDIVAMDQNLEEELHILRRSGTDERG